MTKKSLNDLEKTISTLKTSMDTPKLPKGFDQRFLAVLAKEPEPKKPLWVVVQGLLERRWFHVPAWSYAATTALLVITLFTYTHQIRSSNWVMDVVIAQEIEMYENLDLLDHLDELEAMEKETL